MRFSLGPALLQQKTQGESQDETIPTHSVADEGTALLPVPHNRRIRIQEKLKDCSLKVFHAIKSIWNPPLTGALLAVLVGLIPPVKRQFYDQQGFFYGTITTSLSNIGELFTALMLFILGANLQIKTQRDSETPIKVLLYIYVMRFIIMPIIGIVIVWKISAWGWLDDTAHKGLGGDPMMKFIMCIMPAGPPYITLTTLMTEQLCWQILQNWRESPRVRLESC
jgi:predicted permease